METVKKHIDLFLISVIILLVSSLIFILIKQNPYLLFSDSAKYADVARNLVQGNGNLSNFSFFWGPPVTLPLVSYSLALFFNFLGVSDLVVMISSSFYFILALVFTFLLAKKIIGGKLGAFLATLIVGFNYDLINYATSGATESLFILELVATSYFLLLKQRWSNFLSLGLVVAIYLTRPQGFIYIAGFFIFWLLMNFNFKKSVITLVISGTLLLFVDYFIISRINESYSIISRGLNVITQVAVGESASHQLRGGISSNGFSVVMVFKKLFYNLYNLYKLLPQIINPYFFALFILGLFRIKEEEKYNIFKITSFFIVGLTFVVTSLSIPLFRYIHPVIPFIYILAVDTLIWTLKQAGLKNKFIVGASMFLILFFGIGQTIGIVFLDSRFKSDRYNIARPPVYFILAQKIKENTASGDLILTNLDTWGSWYGERKTVWFPLHPEQIFDENDMTKFNAIYLTSYLKDDENYYMNDEWRQIFENPDSPEKWNCNKCDEIAKQFVLKKSFEINSADVYENISETSILLVKK